MVHIRLIVEHCEVQFQTQDVFVMKPVPSLKAGMVAK